MNKLFRLPLLAIGLTAGLSSCVKDSPNEKQLWQTNTRMEATDNLYNYYRTDGGELLRGVKASMENGSFLNVGERVIIRFYESKKLTGATYDYDVDVKELYLVNTTLLKDDGSKPFEESDTVVGIFSAATINHYLDLGVSINQGKNIMHSFELVKAPDFGEKLDTAVLEVHYDKHNDPGNEDGNASQGFFSFDLSSLKTDPALNFSPGSNQHGVILMVKCVLPKKKNYCFFIRYNWENPYEAKSVEDEYYDKTDEDDEE